MSQNPLTYASMIVHPQWMLPHAFRTNISQCTFKSDRDFEFVKLLVCQISICSNDYGYTLCCCEMLSCICQTDVFKHCKEEQWTLHCCEGRSFFLSSFFLHTFLKVQLKFNDWYLAWLHYGPSGSMHVICCIWLYSSLSQVLWFCCDVLRALGRWTRKKDW